jgi:membrane protein required for colicin V production
VNAIDLILLLPLGLAFIRGYRKGFVLEVFTVIALVIAIIACMRITSFVMAWLQSIADLGQWLPFLAYVLTFIGAFLIVLWAGKLIEKVIEAGAMGIVNKLLGAAVTVITACFLISVFFWMLNKVDALPKNAKDGSFAYRTLDGFAPKVIEAATDGLPWFRNMVQDISDSFGKDEHVTA